MKPSNRLKDLQETAYQRFLLWKRIEYFLKMPYFRDSYESASQDARQQFANMVAVGNLEGMKLWSIQHAHLLDLSERQLRKRAQLANIPAYSRLKRNELIKALSGTTD